MKFPKFLREMGGAALLMAATALLTLQFAPAKTVVETRFESGATPASSAPAYAQNYMDALCAMDAEYLTQNTSPEFAGADEIVSFIEDARFSKWACGPVKYLGVYQLSDKHVFAVVVFPNTDQEAEVFYALTFSDGLVVSIE